VSTVRHEADQLPATNPKDLRVGPRRTVPSGTPGAQAVSQWFCPFPVGIPRGMTSPRHATFPHLRHQIFKCRNDDPAPAPEVTVPERSTHLTRLLLTVPLVAAVVVPAPGQEQPDIAQYGISLGVSGSPGPEDSFNPLTVLYRKWPVVGAQVLGFINYRQPRTQDEIAEAAGLSDTTTAELLAALDTCGLVRQDSSGFRVTFAVFDDDVWAAFDSILVSVGQGIAARVMTDILPRLKEAYEASELAASGIPFAVAAPVLVGALGLDERALVEMERRDIVRIMPSRPDGRRWGVLAQRNRPRPPRPPLWGIHSMGLGSVYFGTFGDNGAMNARRGEIRTLPNLVWTWRTTGERTAEEADQFVAALADLVARFGNGWFVPTELSKSQQSLLAELRARELVQTPDGTRHRLTFPVFTASDRRRFEPFITEAAEIAVEAIVQAQSTLAAAYQSTLPAANGVPLPEALNLVYHSAYSRALDHLLEHAGGFRFAYEAGELRYTGYALQR
jgi:hypothetical protein